ncbi:MAG: GNAT family N-acetyltransferase [Alphaproteobacteria bacterium]|nr:GNAT family N-acetyltransferase [Alphaproteobacteria bacterium]|tara:strand:+ start:2648 stop:3295 length:648 start_codon:yes stop_codon:yes gene_type:complete
MPQTDQRQNHIEAPIEPLMRAVPMPIETERLILRPTQTGDGAALAEAVQETWDQLNEWMIWAKDRAGATEEMYESYARENAARFIQRENFAILAFERASGRLIGSTGLHQPDWTLGRCEIGYWVRTSAQGQGYAQEIAHALTVYAFNALQMNTVLIAHAAGNDRSQRIIERLGFAPCGVIPNGIIVPSGALLAEHIYCRTDLNGLPERPVSWPEP